MSEGTTHLGITWSTDLKMRMRAIVMVRASLQVYQVGRSQMALVVALRALSCEIREGGRRVFVLVLCIPVVSLSSNLVFPPQIH